LLTAFAAWERFPLAEKLAGFIQLALQAGHALFCCDLVKGGAIAQLPFKLVDLLLGLHAETLNLLPLSLPPDLVEVAKQLVNKSWRQIGAVVLTECVRQGVGFIRDPLV
jgi:hypothetical protein